MARLWDRDLRHSVAVRVVEVYSARLLYGRGDDLRWASLLGTKMRTCGRRAIPCIC